MKTRLPLLLLLFLAIAMYAQPQRSKANMLPDSPLKQLEHAFPKSIEFKNHGHLIKFCPDNTCDAFSSKSGVPQSALEDLAFLYEFYFSDFAYLEDWRGKDDSKAEAEQILARPEYRQCQVEQGKKSARCVIETIASKGQVQLLFVRYDEHQRNVVRRNLKEELSRAPTDTQP